MGGCLFSDPVNGKNAYEHFDFLTGEENTCRGRTAIKQLLTEEGEEDA
jgi:hypothetical protein